MIGGFAVAESQLSHAGQIAQLTAGDLFIWTDLELINTNNFLIFQDKMGADWLAYGYGALVTSGGIIGYAKAGKSIMSILFSFILQVVNYSEALG